MAIFFNQILSRIQNDDVLFLAGAVKSPSLPDIDHYQDNEDTMHTIIVDSDKIVRLEFTYFDVEWHPGCQHDFVKVIDGDGTVLMKESCGSSLINPAHYWYFLQSNITSRSNRVDIIFHSNSAETRTGWSLKWTAVMPGLFSNIIDLILTFRPMLV